ncbi:anti-sigma factor family protein [Paenibacillus sp. MBLB4367]|uniref:anti-sigma factor family protein n=1 Tax=Paenibacillus sp. MBLB4367 TaxID=3384767 RepID=UPI003907FAA0
MKCEDIQELFGDYFDLPETDLKRLCVDEHVRRCKVCAEQFEIWEESLLLIQTAARDIPSSSKESYLISNQVMDRIYKDESWRIPIADRIYAIPYRIRRNLTAVLSFCLALFLFSFMYTFAGGDLFRKDEAQSSSYGFHQAAKASEERNTSINVSNIPKFAMASTSGRVIEPMKLGPIHTYADYLLAISILGLISSLLIMNWLSRTRS